MARDGAGHTQTLQSAGSSVSPGHTCEERLRGFKESSRLLRWASLAFLFIFQFTYQPENSVDTSPHPALGVSLCSASPGTANPR